MGQRKTKILERFDKDGDKVLNQQERKAAMEFVQKEIAEGRMRRGPGGPRGFGGPRREEEPAKPGQKLSPADVQSYPAEAGLYDPKVLRTIFLEFEDADWEKELSSFKNTDIEIPAKVMVDGKNYAEVGIHFRGMSSFGMVAEGRKRSLNLSFDFRHKEQNLAGYRTLELLNSHEDPTFLRYVLSCQIAREYIPAPKANFVRVVIDGENWGIYANAEAFNKEFIKEWFGTTKGARWKVSGSPGGQGSLKYLGEDPAPYKDIYQIKSKDEAKSWSDLIKLCKVLNETPSDKLEERLSPILDIDGALKFLALENTLINNDGYWIRTSDYNLYEDTNGRFHLVLHDSNETFSRAGGGRPGGPGRRFGPPQNNDGPPGGERRPLPGPGFQAGGQGVRLDPLLAAQDENKPLISKLLAVESLRKRYLQYVREIAEKWLDWARIGPIAEEYHALIAKDVALDTRKLDSTEAFERAVTEDIAGGGGFGGRGVIGLKPFAEQRRAYLLDYPAIKELITASRN